MLYRKHTHRNQLLDALRRKRIPFVIRRFSILSSTLVRDLLAYLRLIAVPSDNVACARVLAAPIGVLEPRDLVRLAERADKNHRRPIWDEVEAAVNSDDTARSNDANALGKKHASAESRAADARAAPKRAKSISASELLDELIERSELAPLPSDADRQYLERFVAFVKEWERKSEGTQLRDFIEYLGYFNELDGDICLDEEFADDRRAVDDRAFGQRAGVSTRLHPAARERRFPFEPRARRCSSFRRN